MTASETDTSTEVLTIDEAAAILRISRNAAYTLARQWRTTGGRIGLPCLELGRSLRVPRAAIRQMLEGVTSNNGDEADDRVA
jgi:hypothetical protein